MKLVFLLIVVAASLVVVLRYIESRSIFFPMKGTTTTPKDIGLAYEDVTFESDGYKLHAWFVPRDRAKGMVLFFHGNAGNIGHRLDKLHILNELGLETLIIDYRGYGQSEGRASEKGLTHDADAAYVYLTKTKGVSTDRIILYGESLGGAVAVDLAERKPVAALITEGAFTSIPAMVRASLPFVPTFTLALRFDSLSKIERVSARKLFIHSVDDEIVPYPMGEALYDRAKEPKEFLRLRGGHNTAFFDSVEIYTEGLRRFTESLNKPK